MAEFGPLCEDAQGEIVSHLDPPSRMCLALASPSLYTRFHDPSLFGSHFLTSAHDYSYKNLVIYTIEDLKCPFHIRMFEKIPQHRVTLEYIAFGYEKTLAWVATLSPKEKERFLPAQEITIAHQVAAALKRGPGGPHAERWVKRLAWA